MNDEDLVQAIKQAFASTFVVYLQAQNYHWNVEGPMFPQLHSLFGTIYEEIYGSVDTFAEEIRALGSYAPGTIHRFIELNTLYIDDDIPDARGMLSNLLQNNNDLLSMLNVCFEMCDNAGLQGLADFIAGRIDAHNKHAWMLRATLK